MPQIINHPKYGKVSFPDGMGDEEIVSIFKKIDEQNTPVAPQPSMLDRVKSSFIESQKSTDQKAAELMGKVDEILLASPARQAAPEDITTVGQAAFQVGKKIAPTVARYGPVAAAAIALPTGVGTVPALGFLAATGLAGETAARGLEGRPTMNIPEQIQTGVESTIFAPLRKAPGLLNYLTGSTLEGLGLTVAEQNRLGQSIADVSPYNLGASMAIAYGGRGLEGRMLFNQANKDAQAINRAYDATSKELARSINERGLKEVMSFQGIPSSGPKSARESAEILAGATQNKALESFIAIEEGLKAREYAQNVGGLPSTARQSAEVLAGTPQNSALESFIAIDNGLKERGRLALDFAQAKNELRAKELAQEMKLNQLGTQESIEIVSPLTAQATFLDTKLGEGVGAVRERARLAAQAEQTPAAIASRRFDQSNSISAKLSPKAQRMMDEYGFIDPRLAGAIARSGIGGLAGVIQGDTIEEDLGYGLGYAIAGAVLSPSVARKVGTVAKEIGTSMGKVKNNWVPEITLKPFMAAIQAGDAEARGLMVESNFAYRQLNSALNKFEAGAQREAANDAVFEYINERKSIQDLPAILQPAAQNARDAVDGLSTLLVDRQVATGKIADTILDNRGSYVRRAYELFANPDFKPDPAVFKQWVDAHVADKLKDPKNTFTSAELQQQFTNEATRLLDRNVAGQYVTQGYAKTDRNIFTARNPNLDALTRKLYGEINDPLLLLSDTSSRIAKTAADYKMRSNMVEIGERLDLMSRNANDQLTKSIVENVDPLNPLSGYFTTPAIRDAFNSISNSQSSALMKALSTASSATKIPKTLGSFKAYTSNVYGGASDLFAQGHALEMLDKNNWSNAIGNLAIEFGIVSDNGKLSQNKALQFHKKLVELGVNSKSIPAQDFVNAFDSSFIKGKVKLVDNAIDFLSKIYSAPESFSKVFAFAGELKTMKAAFPKSTLDEQMKMAAEKVRSLNTNYDSQWKVIRKASQIGALDPFVAYTADRYRITYNTFRIGLDEMKSGNPVLQKAGAKRIAFTVALLAGAGVAGSNYGIDRNEQEALRRRAPDYLKNGFLRISKTGDNEVGFTNLNYNIPQTVVIEAAAAAMRGDNSQQAAENFMSVFGEQFLGASLFASPIFQLAANKNSQGVPVISSSDTLAQQISGGGKFLLGEWFTPSVVADIKNAKKVWDEPVMSTSGKITNMGDITKANLAGIRTQRYSIPERMTSEARTFNANIAEDTRMFKEKKKTSLLESEKQAAYNEFEQRRMRQFEKITQWAKDAKTLGMDENAIAKMGREAKLAPKLILGAIDGIYSPSAYQETLSTTEQIMAWKDSGKTQAQIVALIKAEAKINPLQAMSLASSYKRMASESIRGITDMDKLIMSLDDANGDRMKYLTQKAKIISDEQGPNLAQGYLLQLEKKGIISLPLRAQLESAGVMQKKRY